MHFKLEIFFFLTSPLKKAMAMWSKATELLWLYEGVRCHRDAAGCGLLCSRPVPAGKRISLNHHEDKVDFK